MKLRNYFTKGIPLLFIVPLVSLAQTPDALLKILDDTSRIESRQQQIDSFLKLNEETMLPHQLADCYHDLGSKWHYKNWEDSQKIIDLKNAIQVTTRALSLKRNLEELEDCSMNKTLYNLGFFLSLDDRIHEAKDMYVELIEKGRQYCPENSQENDQIHWALQELGDLYLITGDFYRAMDSYKTLISMIDSSDRKSTWDYHMIIFSHLYIADIYSLVDAKGNIDLIKEHLGLAQDYLTESDLPCCQYQGDINQQYGNALLDVKNYGEALKYHQKALKFLLSEDSFDVAIVHNSLGISYLNLERDTMALESFDKAISHNIHYSDPYNNMGDLYVKKEDFEKAMKNYQMAIDLEIDRNAKFSGTRIPAIDELQFLPNKIPLLNHIVTKANGWLAYYEYDNNPEHLLSALETFTLADKLVDLIRYESSEQQSKLYWREQGASLYMKAVKVCHLLNRPEEALHFMERNKALLLLEDLTNEEAKDIAHLPQDIAQREYKLKRNIFLTEDELYEADGNKTAIESLKTLLKDNKYVYQKFIDSLNQAYPDYARYKNKAAILTFNEMQSNYISDGQVVLHYILNEEDGYGLLTSTEGPILFQLKDGAQLNDQIDSLTSLLTSGISDITTLNTISNTLFNNLIPAEIYNKINGKQLIIVPDYTLQRVPFETLVVDKTNTKYLIEDAEIAYVYSMSLLHHNKGIARNHSKELLSLAPIHFDKLELVELRNSEHEVTGISSFFDGEVFLDDQASKANFLKEVAAPKIIHLATHADIGNGENPWIAFSDEKMYLKEIYATKNQSEMVVLSACNTLSGDLKRGEGVMSLARGFFYSGAKSVVSSLWPLTDESGSDIMISFYKNLDKGQSKSKALRQAKLEYMNSNIVEELKHPFYWAGFIVVGDNAPLVATRHSIWIYIGIVFVLVIGYLFRRKFLKRLQ